MFYFFLLMVGVAVGSFLNVCIYRIPRGLSVVSPSSHCPRCKTPIRWYDNIPLLSFLLLGGKCRYCEAPISSRYPLVEGLSGFLFLGVGLKFPPPSPSFFQGITLIVLLIPIFFIDLEHKIIPDSFSFLLLGSGLLFSLFKKRLFLSLLGGGAGFSLFFFIYLLSFLIYKEEGMGFGDVKLASGVGTNLGLSEGLLSFFLSFLFGGILGGLLLLSGKKGKREKIPFGPFLCLGTFISFFLGERILEFYFGLF